MDNLNKLKTEFGIETQEDLTKWLDINRNTNLQPLKLWEKYQEELGYVRFKEEMISLSLNNGNDSTFGSIVRKLING